MSSDSASLFVLAMLLLGSDSDDDGLLEAMVDACGTFVAQPKSVGEVSYSYAKDSLLFHLRLRQNPKSER